MAVNNYRFLSSFACYHPEIPARKPDPPPPHPPSRHRFWRFIYDRFAFAYDAVLHWAHRLHIGSERRVRVEVIAGLDLPAGAFVLDVGCGSAANREFLPAHISYIGVDLSRNMLRAAKAKSAPSTLVQADAISLPFRHSFAPLVIAMGVLQHVTEPARAITQMQRIASPGAQLLIIDELRSADRILPTATSPPVRKIGEYFVMSLRKD